MSLKFLKMLSGRVQEEAAIQATTGAPDAGKLVGTASDGKIDQSFLPAGEQVILAASEALAAGDMVNVFDSGSGVPKARKADAATAGKEADGFVTAAVSQGASATVYLDGSDSQLASLTVGARYYLSDAAPGGVVSTPPAGAGKVVQFVGRAISATSLAFERDAGVILA